MKALIIMFLMFPCWCMAQTSFYDSTKVIIVEVDSVESPTKDDIMLGMDGKARYMFGEVLQINYEPYATGGVIGGIGLTKDIPEIELNHGRYKIFVTESGQIYLLFYSKEKEKYTALWWCRGKEGDERYEVLSVKETKVPIRVTNIIIK